MSVPTQYEIDKALVSNSIQHTLSTFEKDVYDKVIKRLDDDNFSIPDCFDHPEYLQKILKEIFGSSFTKIIHSMQIWLEDSASNQLISNFLISTLKESSASTVEDKYLAKSAILLAIKKSLLKMGMPELKRVEAKLLSDFNYTLDDCVRNPIPLKKVLCELFGYCYEDIYQSMNATLTDSSMDEDIMQFLVIMKE